MNLRKYEAERDRLLDRIISQLKQDSRVVAAWLTGSLGRGQGDQISDIDLTAVLTDDAAHTLCLRPEQLSNQPPQERLDFISQFSQPSLIHENHNNAPPEGTFTFVQYTKSALIVDWILVPQTQAKRPSDSLLLFDKAGIPLAPLPELPDMAERARIASEKAAFFWMMASVIVKYIAREDTLLINSWLDDLHWMIADVEGLIAGAETKFDPTKRLPIALNKANQKDLLHEICGYMMALSPAILEMGGFVTPNPITAVEQRLSLI